MIWACTVCDNHFDGDSPPEACSSCGSPAEYFTEYYHYSEDRPANKIYHPSKVDREKGPAYSEASVENARCFRFHSDNYFHREPSAFYKNFLETRRTFKAQHRFAGRSFNSGFYFAMTKESAVAEQLEYSKVKEMSSSTSPQTVLAKLNRPGHERVFLEVALTLDKIADLTDPIVLQHFLQHGPARAELRHSGMPYEFARTISTAGFGGGRLTNGIGYHAYIGGWNAVKFPSVRSLTKDWGIRELSQSDFIHRMGRDYPETSEDDLESQLRNQTIIVVFSGSLLTRSIASYTWIDASGRTGAEANPHFGISAAALESVRKEFRNKRKMDPLKAVKLGFLSDDEIAYEFKAQVMWVNERESL